MKFLNVSFVVCFAMFLLCNCKEGHLQKVDKEVMRDKEKLPTESRQEINYDSSVLQISQNFKAETYDALFSDSLFMGIYKNPSLYLKKTIEFLSQDKFNNAEKKISICLMQGLSLDDYLQLFSEAEDLFRQKKIDESLLVWVINPNFSDRHILVRNYRNDKVINLLTFIKSDPSISLISKNIIENILSGKLSPFLTDNRQ